MSARLQPGWSLWSTAEVERLRRMAAAGVTMKRAAGELGRAECAVKCKAMREGIRFGRKGWRKPGPGALPEQERFRRSAEQGSARLKAAIEVCATSVLLPPGARVRGWAK